MTKSLICIAALLLVSAFAASCGGNGARDTLTNHNGNSSTSTAPYSSSATTAKTVQPTNPSGYIDRVDCDALSGWVLDKDRPEEPVQLELYADDKLQAKLQASALFRKDLLDAKIGTGNYAFVFPIPINLKDGIPHPITLKVAGTNYELEFWMSTPRFVVCSP